MVNAEVLEGMVKYLIKIWFNPKPLASQVVLLVKNPASSVGDVRDAGSIPGLRQSPWRRAQQPTPVLSTGKSHGQRNLVGYGTWGHKESDTTEAT